MRSAPRKQWPFRQLEFCFRWEPAAVAPDASELRTKAAGLLREIGAHALAARVRVEWNPRMCTAVGRAEPARARITLNPALQNFGPAEIDRTLRHELAHLLAHARAGRRRIFSHGPEWRSACAELGIAGERACHKLPLPARQFPRRYLYHCTNCHALFPRVRRLRRPTACLACCRRFNRGAYDERFRLQPAKARNRT